MKRLIVVVETVVTMALPSKVPCDKCRKLQLWSTSSAWCSFISLADVKRLTCFSNLERVQTPQTIRSVIRLSVRVYWTRMIWLSSLDLWHILSIVSDSVYWIHVSPKWHSCVACSIGLKLLNDICQFVFITITFPVEYFEGLLEDWTSRFLLRRPCIQLLLLPPVLCKISSGDCVFQSVCTEHHMECTSDHLGTHG